MSWHPITKPLNQYPNGTMISTQHCRGYWLKQGGGWQWCSGITQQVPVGATEVWRDPGMTVSMNGFRRNLAGDVSSLRSLVEDVLKGNHYDEEDLADAMNDVIRNTNVLQCIHQKDDPSFSDQSHIEVEEVDIDAIRHDVRDW